MKKLIIRSEALGAVVAPRPVVKRRMAQEMREHCKQMMRQFIEGSETTADGATGPEAMPPRCASTSSRWPRDTSSGGAGRDGLSVRQPRAAMRSQPPGRIPG